MESRTTYMAKGSSETSVKITTTDTYESVLFDDQNPHERWETRIKYIGPEKFKAGSAAYGDDMNSVHNNIVERMKQKGYKIVPSEGERIDDLTKDIPGFEKIGISPAQLDKFRKLKDEYTPS
jgi:hypothetical protein